ncbi:MAG: hypothetical protein AB7S61_00880 [Methanoregulaceae archaeon]
MRWWRSHDVVFAIILISISFFIYYEQLSIFHDPETTTFYFFQDFAFLPISILVVTLVLERLLELRDRQQRIEKIRMLTGTFFSWTGYKLLARLASLDESRPEYAKTLIAGADWTDAEFLRARNSMATRRLFLRPGNKDLVELREFLYERAEFMIRLLENPMILEHETFTELLRAIFHLIEELEFRDDLEGLPESDIEHLRNDAERIYRLLVMEWIDHLRYLQRHYPYLYSLAARTNPFDEQATVVVKS